MIIKNLLEIVFYSSLLVVKKIGSTIEENLPFSTKKEKIDTVPLRTVKATPEPTKAKTEKNKKTENKQVTQKEKGSQQKTTKVKIKGSIKNEIKEVEAKESVLEKQANPKDNKPDYSTMTKKELYEIAQEIDLEGRSTMKKSQLLKALQQAKK